MSESYLEKTTALIVTSQQQMTDNYSSVDYDPDIEPPYDPDDVDTAADMTNPSDDGYDSEDGYDPEDDEDDDDDE